MGYIPGWETLDSLGVTCLGRQELSHSSENRGDSSLSGGDELRSGRSQDSARVT